ncbi:AtpZ/AtpI family protein [Allobaculum fili]|uniref:AtpZ/AtpI family protein n=1 Tax=Allobaculum TaxID=174708 RepID=UPI001E372D28|nr:AtpZ/AtpI family protein [Allobaculum fili]
MNPMKFGGFLLVNLLVCIWLGYLIDSWTNMSPVWIIVFTLYAIIGSFLVLLYRNKKKDKKKSSGKE